MAQALEKIFLQKVAQMPQEEVALLPPAPKGKNKSKQPAAATTGEYCSNTTVLSNRYYVPVLTVLCVCFSESAGGVISLPSPLLPLSLPLSDTCHLDHAHTCPDHTSCLCSAAPGNHDAVCTARRQGNRRVVWKCIT